MGTYKGNKGNLMQHWTLCEVLEIAKGQGVTQLNYVDAHAMAPLATKRTSSDTVFDRVRDALPGQKSVYEKAWHVLTSGRDSYPNSANFVTQVWQGDYSLLLCETNTATASKIRPWLDDVRRSTRCKHAELFECDWRQQFKQGLPTPSDVGLGGNALTYISFDPYMISKSHAQFMKNPGSLYPQDLDNIGQATGHITGGVLLQLSTYTTNGGNSQGVVIQVVDSGLKGYGFERVARTRVKGERANAMGYMMSLIYAREADWARKELGCLEENFSNWRNQAKRL